MADNVINLRQRRKAKARAERRAEADRNAAAHGVPAAVTELSRAREEKARRALDAHKLDAPRPEEGRDGGEDG